jgi:hypothetical protein
MSVGDCTNVNNHYNNEKSRGYYSYLFLILITLGFYTPVFYRNFLPKINALSQRTFGAKAQKTNFATKSYTIGWCIIVAPLVLVLASILLDVVFGMTYFNLDFSSLDKLFVSMITYVSGIIPGATFMEALIGCTAIWLISVFATGVYFLRKTSEINDQIGPLARYYNISVTSTASSTVWGQMEKFNIMAGKALIEDR